MKSLAHNSSALLVKLVLIFTLLYWTYLVIVSQMVVVQDAFVFESIAKIFYTDGWIGYFKSGPTREPIYPYIISLSMHLSDITHIPYQDIQKIFQLIFALSGQYLLWRVLTKININGFITAIILFYFAISPDIVNSIVSLFSEVITFPLALCIIILTSSLRDKLSSKEVSFHPLLLQSVLLGSFFLILILTKGAFEFIFPFYFLSFLPFLYRFLKNRQPFFLKRLSVILLIISLNVLLPVHFIKSMNKKYNGNYVLTDRGAFMLYGNTSRHLEAFSFKRIVMGFVCVTQASEQKICNKLFGQQECSFWDFRNSDAYAHQKCTELANQGYTPEQINKKLVHITMLKILQNPFHYFPYYCLEALAVIFWKSGEIGFVAYPYWLSYLYDKTNLRFILSFVSALFTLVALINLAILNLKELTKIKTLEKTCSFFTTPFYVGLFVFGFIALHATISVQTRYCLAIVPLYLIAIAIFLNQLFYKNSRC